MAQGLRSRPGQTIRRQLCGGPVAAEPRGGGSAEGSDRDSDGRRQQQQPQTPRGFGGPSSRGQVSERPTSTEALLQSLGEVSSTSGREPGSHLIMSDDASAEAWQEVDEKVNQYPILREFQAIGSGGDDFRQAMTAAVASVVGYDIPDSKVSLRWSSKKKYCSVTIGPIEVATREQLTAIYTAMRSDTRVRWWM